MSFYFYKLITKDNFFLGNYLFIYFVIEFQNPGNKHDHGFLLIKYAPMYGVYTNEEIEWFVDMYISYDVSLIPNPLQNA